MSESQVRPARPEDAEAIVRLVRGLAVYEKADPEQVKLTPADVVRDGFGPERKFEMLVAEHEGRVVGLVLFFTCLFELGGVPANISRRSIR